MQFNPFVTGVSYMHQSQTFFPGGRPFKATFRGDDPSCRSSMKRYSQVQQPGIRDGCVYDTPVPKMFSIDQYVIAKKFHARFIELPPMTTFSPLLLSPDWGEICIHSGFFNTSTALQIPTFVWPLASSGLSSSRQPQ
ncbi:hypothetical protein TNCV_1040501 [Trichonephila clavipes]|nr:hypothetical protein TNCV_1040501 [Trichonephila clavipes]